MSDKIQPTHLERRAIVYLRQSTLRQVHDNHESTSASTPWGSALSSSGGRLHSVEIIDDDFGAQWDHDGGPSGFQRLANDVAHGQIGAIFALEVSRLARSSADWHRLLDLCGLADVVIVDEQTVYIPRDPNDRLLLGLKGTMSDAEQYWMRLRLDGGRLIKPVAESCTSLRRQGTSGMPRPHDFVWTRMNASSAPCVSCRAVPHRWKCARVMRFLASQGLQMPAIDKSTGAVRWNVPCHDSIRNMLLNPAYAGAYAFGRRESRVGLIDGKARRRVRRLPESEWKVCLRDHHPCYLSWDEFLMNRSKLCDNMVKMSESRGAAREGSALLQGLARCGRCGRRMSVRYRRGSKDVRYECGSLASRRGTGRRCWTVAARMIDPAIATLFLAAVQIPEIELAFAVARETERQAKDVEEQWSLRRERLTYDARLAERRYKAVDPDNRVIARTLERDWNEKLEELERLESEYQAVRRRQKLDLSEKDHARILTLAHDLPGVWSAPTTTPAERKNLLRVLVKEVLLSPVDAPSRSTRIQVLWQTGAISEVVVERPRQFTPITTPAEVIERIRALVAAGKSYSKIAKDLNKQHLGTAQGHTWDRKSVYAVGHRLRLQPQPTPRPHRHPTSPPHGRAVLRSWGRRARRGRRRGRPQLGAEGRLSSQAGGGSGRARWLSSIKPPCDA